MLILIPAAGASSRMRGGDKLLEEVDGMPMLARQAQIALASGAQVMVTLPCDHPGRAAVLDQADFAELTVKRIADAPEGMAASLRAGADHAQNTAAQGLMILPGDMPEIETQDLTHMIAGFDGENPMRASDSAGTPGHPVIFPPRLFSALSALTGDAGARRVLAGEDVVDVRLPGHRATTDLDTPEAWAAWRAKTGR